MARKTQQAPDDLLSDDIQDWGKYAACKGKPQEWWFADNLLTSTGRMNTRNAKMLCEICIVRAKCLDYANTNEESFGIWGGLTPQERGYKRWGALRRTIK